MIQILMVKEVELLNILSMRLSIEYCIYISQVLVYYKIGRFQPNLKNSQNSNYVSTPNKLWCLSNSIIRHERHNLDHGKNYKTPIRNP